MYVDQDNDGRIQIMEIDPRSRKDWKRVLNIAIAGIHQLNDLEATSADITKEEQK